MSRKNSKLNKIHNEDYDDSSDEYYSDVADTDETVGSDSDIESDNDYSVEQKTEDSEIDGGESESEDIISDQTTTVNNDTSTTTIEENIVKRKKKEEITNEKELRKCIYESLKEIRTKPDNKKIIEISSPKKGEIDRRITRKILTHYEKVKILSDRTHQLEQGAKPMVKNVSGLTSKEIALLELNSIISYTDENGKVITNRALPMIINRELPNGVIEVFKLGELKLYE